MKRTVLMKMFLKAGWWILREGANHTIMTNGEVVEPMPRHREINEELAKSLVRKYKLR
ncbi:MAG: toxin-antitoxin system, toxin component, HicA family protein [Clostridia bacterium]|nr:toxin-antitoxin system, toxin component, HicA family protein [Clostridia bacterium]